MFLDIARSSKKAPSDPGEHYLATDILSRDIRAYTASLMKEDLPYEQLDLIASLIEEADFTAALTELMHQVARRVRREKFSSQAQAIVDVALSKLDVSLREILPDYGIADPKMPAGLMSISPRSRNCATARWRSGPMLARPNAARSWLYWVRSSGRRSSSIASTPSANPSTARACLPALHLARKSNRARWAMQA